MWDGHLVEDGIAGDMEGRQNAVHIVRLAGVNLQMDLLVHI
jgi:hypothetical protein